MGLMDKIKDKTKDISGSAAASIDKGKLDQQIREEQKKLETYTKEIGELVVKSLRENSEVDQSVIQETYDKILACESKIAELDAQKVEVSNKFEQEKAQRDKERTAKELEEAEAKAAEANARAEELEKTE